jgi:ribosomal protein S18 acetylase RimI-like enzyme
MEFSLKPDFDACCEIIRQGGDWVERTGLKTWKSWNIGNLTDENLLKQYPDKSKYFVIEKNEIPVVGTILYDYDIHGDFKEFPGKSLYIYKTAVSDEARGRASPAGILNALKNHARSLGFEYLRMDCDGTRKNLVRFYERLGFRFIIEDHEDEEFTGLYEVRGQLKIS